MKIDLDNIVYLSIGGEIGKNHSLPLDYFADLAKSLQALVNNIAKHDLDAAEAISLSNFKVELVDFRKGSAVPGFRFSQGTNLTLTSELGTQRKKVSESFERLMVVSDAGDYNAIKEIYPHANQRNAIVKSLYSFVDKTKTPQTRFVEFKKGKPVALFRVRKFKKEVRDSLIVEIDTKQPGQPETRIAEIKITNNRRVIKKVHHEDSIVSHVFSTVSHEETTYSLYSNLPCTIELEGDGLLIECPMIGVVGAGDTKQEAIDDFSEEFDYMYKRLTGLSDEKLSKKMQSHKRFFAALIKSIEK